MEAEVSSNPRRDHLVAHVLFLRPITSPASLTSQSGLDLSLPLYSKQPAQGGGVVVELPMLCIGLPQEKGKNSITETPYALLTHRNNDNLEMASLSPIIAMCRIPFTTGRESRDTQSDPGQAVKLVKRDASLTAAGADL